MQGQIIFELIEEIRNASIYFHINEKNIGLHDFKLINPGNYDLKWL